MEFVSLYLISQGECWQMKKVWNQNLVGLVGMVIFSWISDLMGSFPVILILWFYYCWSKIFFLGIFKLNNCLQTTCSSRSVVILLLTSMTMLITIGKTPPRLLVLVQLLTTTSWKKREDILFYSCGKENQKETNKKKKKSPFFLPLFLLLIIFQHCLEFFHFSRCCFH